MFAVEPKFSKPGLRPYAYAAGIIVLAFIARAAVDPYTGDNVPLFIFMVAVVTAAWKGGTGPGLFATVVGLVLGNYFFIAPRYSFAVAERSDLARLGGFVMVGLVSSLVSGKLMRAKARAERSEESFRLLVEGVRDTAILGLGPDGAIERWNAGATRLTGFSESDLKGQSLSRLYADTEEAERLLTTALTKGSSAAEAWHVRKDGTRFWAESTVTVLRNGHGALRGFSHLIRDITERKQAERALAEQLSISRAITDNATTALFIVDKRQHCIFMNPAAEKLTGYTLQELAERPLHSVIHHTRRDGSPYPAEECPIGVVLANEMRATGEEVFVHKDGHFYDVAFTASPVRDADARTVGMVVEVQDITERAHAEQALRDSEERFRALADNIPQLAWMADATGSITWYNQRWYDYTGTTFDEVKGWGWQKVHHPDHMDRVTRVLMDCFKRGDAWEDTFPLRSAQGEWRWFLSRALPIRNGAGHVARWFGTNTDVTEQLNTERELRRANFDLEQFAYSASHDLQEPLRNVAVYSQLLKRRYATQFDEQGQRFLTYLIEGAHRMELLLTGLLAYSQAGTLDRSPLIPSSAEAVLEDVLINLENAILEAHALITHDPLPTVAVKELHLGQIFHNLLSNAVKYRKDTDPPRIHIGVSREGSRWIFCVRDNGVGIAPQYHDRIFGIFKRLHGRDGRYPGTGIGLAICQKIVERYGGQIWVESTPQVGSTFYFSLPAAAK